MAPFLPPSLLRYSALAVALLAAGCGKRDGNAAWWQGEQQRMELSHQVALKQFRLQRLESVDFAELVKLRASNLEKAVSLKSLKQQRSALRDESDDMQRSLAEFRETFLREHRNRAIGSSFPELTTVTGRMFRDVTVASIDDAGVAIRHTDGTARLKYQDLDSKQQLFFGLEAELAVAAVDRESRDRAAYDRWMDDQMAVVLEKNERLAENTARDERLASENRQRLASQITAAKVNPLAKPATSFGSGSSRYASSFGSYYRRSNYRYVYYTPNYCAPTFPRACSPEMNPSYRPVVTRNYPNFSNTTFPSAP